VTYPEKALLDREYTVYERLSSEPLWLQKALISGGRLRDFLELAREGEEHGGEREDRELMEYCHLTQALKPTGQGLGRKT